MLSAPRTDDYFEAVLVQAGTGDVLNLRVVLKTSKEEIKNVLVEMVDLPIDIFYQIVARKEWFINKSRLELKAEEIKLAMKIADELKEV